MNVLQPLTGGFEGRKGFWLSWFNVLSIAGSAATAALVLLSLCYIVGGDAYFGGAARSVHLASGWVSYQSDTSGRGIQSNVRIHPIEKQSLAGAIKSHARRPMPTVHTDPMRFSLQFSLVLLTLQLWFVPTVSVVRWYWFGTREKLGGDLIAPDIP